jgi:hypothetical protein
MTAKDNHKSDNTTIVRAVQDVDPGPNSLKSSRTVREHFINVADVQLTKKINCVLTIWGTYLRSRKQQLKRRQR